MIIGDYKTVTELYVSSCCNFSKQCKVAKGIQTYRAVMREGQEGKSSEKIIQLFIGNHSLIKEMLWVTIGSTTYAVLILCKQGEQQNIIPQTKLQYCGLAEFVWLVFQIISSILEQPPAGLRNDQLFKHYIHLDNLQENRNTRLVQISNRKNMLIRIYQDGSLSNVSFMTQELKNFLKKSHIILAEQLQSKLTSSCIATRMEQLMKFCDELPSSKLDQLNSLSFQFQVKANHQKTEQSQSIQREQREFGGKANRIGYVQVNFPPQNIQEQNRSVYQELENMTLIVKKQTKQIKTLKKQKEQNPRLKQRIKELQIKQSQCPQQDFQFTYPEENQQHVLHNFVGIPGPHSYSKASQNSNSQLSSQNAQNQNIQNYFPIIRRLPSHEE